MRRLVVASAILASLLILPLGVLAAPPIQAAATDSSRASAALVYLQAAQKANGSLDGSIGETADFVIGAAAAGYDPATLAACNGGTPALSYLATASDGATADAAKTAKTVLAVVAAGGDPTDLAGRNLIARLAALYHSATGAYGDGATFSQAFAVLAVVASGGSVPAAATAELAALQDPDGSWSYGAAPVAAGQGDTNSTAIALMALDAAGVHTADASALAYIQSQQLPDGGFPYQNSSVWGPPTSDPDSDSIVLQALIAAGQNPEAPGWSQGSNTVLTHLRAAQGADGGFAYPGAGEDAFTTSQVPAALMRVPYAAPVTFTAGLRVQFQCIAPTASATPVVTASPTPKPTARRTTRPTVRPTARQSVSPTPFETAAPTDAPPVIATPTPVTTPTAAATPTAAGAPGPTEVAAGATSDATGATALPGSSNGGDPSGPSTLLLYGAVAAFGLIAVLGAGWLYVERPWLR